MQPFINEKLYIKQHKVVCKVGTCATCYFVNTKDCYEMIGHINCVTTMIDENVHYEKCDISGQKKY